MFRSRASGYHDVVPDVERTDQWLFLARHAGVPTRLLDWTEGALIGLHFALQENEKEPVVWMLNPLEMNRLSTPSDPAMLPDPNRIREFPLPWHDPDPDPPPWFPRVRPRAATNPAFENLRGAWDLSIGRVFLREKHYAKLAHDSVEGSVREWKRGSVGRLEGYLFAGPELRPRHLKHWSVEISCRHMHAGRQKIA